MSFFVEFFVIAIILHMGAATVSQCYYCNTQYCSDPYDYKLGAIVRCSDVFTNYKTYFSSRIVSAERSNGSRIRFEDSEDIETITPKTSNELSEETHANILDIQRKFWNFFNKGELDETTEFICAKANYYSTDSNQLKTFRGCVPTQTKTISTACDFINQRVAGGSATGDTRVYNCYTCDTNLCNASISLRASILAAVIGAIVIVAF
ncbi:uncharacterized protein LOC126733466 [Anthonomus grandis grandis]|uniref:uncharacterized protein LOC126733466 n=1 Tax=Anthonomus grandis grandis TaxID=2921223 RepID=UPI00216651EF|nr:uncharacterized protein LOC126733466 [Anthonomus grandis grandis]